MVCSTTGEKPLSTEYSDFLHEGDVSAPGDGILNSTRIFFAGVCDYH